MFQNITLLGIIFYSIFLFLTMDFLICGYIGLTTDDVEKMPRLLVRHLMIIIKKAELKYKARDDRNRFIEFFTSLQAFSAYFVIGGLQLLLSFLIDMYIEIRW
jgi:hypothetical protein